MEHGVAAAHAGNCRSASQPWHPSGSTATADAGMPQTFGLWISHPAPSVVPRLMRLGRIAPRRSRNQSSCRRSGRDGMPHANVEAMCTRRAKPASMPFNALSAQVAAGDARTARLFTVLCRCRCRARWGRAAIDDREGAGARRCIWSAGIDPATETCDGAVQVLLTRVSRRCFSPATSDAGDRARAHSNRRPPTSAYPPDSTRLRCTH